MRDKIVEYINDNNYIDEYQMVFKVGLNTQAAVTKFCDDVRLAINELKLTDAVLFDLRNLIL